MIHKGRTFFAEIQSLISQSSSTPFFYPVQISSHLHLSFQAYNKMHLSSILFGATLLGAPIVHASVLTERAVVDGPCTGSGGNPGVCIATAKCSSGGGISISGACPGTPADIKCCTKTSCGSGGNCRWTSQCTTGNTASGLCPGPADFKVRKSYPDNTMDPRDS